MTFSRVLVLTATGLALVAGAAGVAIATGSNDTDTPITGQALERASAVAIAHLGGGTVTETEVGDEEGYYEVEVTKDGREIDVHLDRNFNVISTEEESGDEGDVD